MKGFTLTAKGKDYFFATDLKNKTKSLAKKIIRSLNGTGDFDIPDNASGIDAILCCCVADAINAKATAATQKGGSKCCDGCSSVDDGNWNFTA